MDEAYTTHPPYILLRKQRLVPRRATLSACFELIGFEQFNRTK